MRVLLAAPPSIDRLTNLVPLGWGLRTGGHETQIAGPSWFTPAINRTGFVAVAAGAGESPVLGDEAVDDLVDYATAWRPQLVVWDQCAPAGAVAARAVGALSVRMLSVFDARPLDDAELWRQLGVALDRHGVVADGPAAELTIDTTPPSLATGAEADRLRIRHVPYSGSSVIPVWLRRMPRSPRIALLPSGSADSTARLLDAVRGVDADVVCVAPPERVPAAITLPDNVRLVDEVPLDVLLPTCRAVVYDSSPTVAAAAVAYGLPRLEASVASVDGVRALIDDPAVRERAGRERAELEALPSPRDVAARLTAAAASATAVGV